MKLKNMLKWVYFLLALAIIAGAAQAGQLKTRASGHLAFQDALNDPISRYAISFDISSIPEDTEVYRAILSISYDADTTIGRKIVVQAIPITSEWSSSEVTSTDQPSVTLSLKEGNYSTSGEGAKVRVFVTELVAQWHSGSLENSGLLITIQSNDGKAFSLRSDGGELQAVLQVFFSE